MVNFPRPPLSKFSKTSSPHLSSRDEQNLNTMNTNARTLKI